MKQQQKQKPPSNRVVAQETCSAPLRVPTRSKRMDCRPGCGACCIAPSISSLNKPAGVPCVHLTADYRCAIFGQPERPACCSGLQPSVEMCGDDQTGAIIWLTALERTTAPAI